MIVSLDAASPVPPYEQLRLQITALIASGSLKIGDRLPAIRQLAGDLGAAPGTIARAYRELESHGLIQSRRTGSIVTNSAKPGDTVAPTERRDRLTHAAVTYRTTARLLGADAEEALALVREILLADSGRS